MGSSLLEEASVPSKNMVSMSSQSSLGGESLNLPNSNSILGVDDGKTFTSPLFDGKTAYAKHVPKIDKT